MNGIVRSNGGSVTLTAPIVYDEDNNISYHPHVDSASGAIGYEIRHHHSDTVYDSYYLMLNPSGGGESPDIFVYMGSTAEPGQGDCQPVNFYDVSSVNFTDDYGDKLWAEVYAAWEKWQGWQETRMQKYVKKGIDVPWGMVAQMNDVAGYCKGLARAWGYLNGVEMIDVLGILDRRAEEQA